MDTFFSESEIEGAEESPHSRHRPPQHHRRSNDPQAPIHLSDGRIYRLFEVRILDSTEADIRWKVEAEAQMDGRGDNLQFRIQIGLESVKNGALEKQGYPDRCTRETAILLLARAAIQEHLTGHRYPPRYSGHARPIMLAV